MLGQHQVLPAHQALCDSQGDPQPNQPGSTTRSTATVLGPSLHPQQDASYLVRPQSYFKPVFQSYRKQEIFHSSLKPVSSGIQPLSSPQWEGHVPLSKSVTTRQPPQRTATSPHRHQHQISLCRLCRLQGTVDRSSGVAQENTQLLYPFPFNHPCRDRLSLPPFL